MVYGERANPVLPCGPAILSLLLAAADWCFSLLAFAGSEQSNLLDRNGFQARREACSPCICENHPANGEGARNRSRGFAGAVDLDGWPRRAKEKNHYGSINRPVVALIAASVRVAAPSFVRALSVWKSTVRLVSPRICATGLFVIWRERQLATMRRRDGLEPAPTGAATTLRTP
jgi:hypothetical protein